MNKWFKYLVLIIFFKTIMSSIEATFELNFPIFRYLLVASGVVCIFKLIDIKEIFKKQNFPFIKTCFFFISILLIHSISIGLDELFSTRRDYINLKSFIGNYALLYSFLLLIFIKPNPIYWKYFINYSFKLLFILVPFLLFNFGSYITREKSPEGIIRLFAGASGFLYFLTPYLKPKEKKIVLGILIISFLFMLYHARRNMVLYFGLFFIFYLLTNLFSSTKIIKNTKVKNMFNIFGLIFFGTLIFLTTNPDFSLFFERAETGMESRDQVIEDFFIDIQPFSYDFYFGRGMYGNYFSRSLGNDIDGERAIGGGVRNIIENGYLQIILNFGFIFLLIFLIISFVGIYNGLFKSHNLLAKACSIVLLVNLIDMIGYGLPEITFKYFLVWLSIPFCFSNYFRNLSDSQIKMIIK